MLNYSTHVSEQLSSTLNNASNIHPTNAIFLGELLALLEKSVKFELPANAAIIDDIKAAETIEPSMLNLPAPAVSLEYPYNNYTPDEEAQTIAAPKRIALCAEFESIVDTQLARAAAKATPTLQMTGGILLYPFFYSQDYWTPSPWGIAIVRTDDAPNLTRFVTGGNENPTEIRLNIGAIPALPEIAEKSMRIVGIKSAKKQALHDCIEEFYALVNFLVALSSPGISIRSRPAPDKLNKKRTAAGKKPFPQYMELISSLT